MAERRLSGWQIVTLILGLAAVIAFTAVFLLMGKDAVIAMAIVFVIGMVLVAWLNS